MQAQLAPASVADTVEIRLAEAERLFQERNLPLLMQKTNIESAKAAVIQAKLFENPVLSLEQNIYNPNNHRYFDVTKSGQTIVALEQLVYLAGKRNKRVKVEELNRQLTEFDYYDLLRTLRFELRTSYLQLHYQLQAYNNLNQRTQAVQQLVTAFDGQYRKGNVPLKEITRLKALLFSLENQKLALYSEIQQQQADLRLLTQTPATTFIIPLVDDAALDRATTGNLSYSRLLHEAQENRYDLKAAETDVQRQEAMLKYQKSLAVPDIAIGGVYDRAGSFVQDYTGVTLSVPLPVFNRNQGNIKIARNEIERSKMQLQLQQQLLENEVMQAYQRARTSEQLYTGFDPGFNDEFDRLIEGVTSSFARRNISLIEFLDYYETYTESINQLLELRNSRLRALEEINYTIGKPLINF
ncbi:MAG: TolC family protein [Hymenobacteraceae bacterium]|nr:TolC family protein [Hymenobacteraceae bacterium]MDX5397752.1 TolC family protein [Hymenobacteraceae bacterium]MDX5513829.1 TolC family protein [Hymenobacteraceae bacterium]